MRLLAGVLAIVASSPFAVNAESCEYCTAAYAREEGRICNRDTDAKGKWAYNSTHINIAVMRDTEDPDWMSTSGDLMFLCALQRIRDDPNLLPGFQVDLVYIDEKFSQEAGIKGALCADHVGIPFVAGPASSSTATGFATLGKIYGLNNIGTYTSSPSLTDKTRFPYFHRMFYSDVYQGMLLARLGYSFGWRKIATFSVSPQAYYDGIVNAFIGECLNLGMEVYSQTLPVGFTEEQMRLGLRNIKASGIRAGMWAGYHDVDVAGIFKSEGVMEDGWGWLGSESLLDEEGVPNYQGFHVLYPSFDHNAATAVALQTCMTEHKNDTSGLFRGLGANPNLDTKLNPHAFIYDAIMVVAQAVHDVITYKNMSYLADAEVMRQAMNNVSGLGATGYFSFDNVTGDRKGLEYAVYKIDSGGAQAIGSVTDSLVLNVDESQLLFPGESASNIPPVDFEMECSMGEHYVQEVSDCNPDRIVSYTPRIGDAARYCPKIASVTVACDYPEASNPLFTVSILALLYCVALGVGIMMNWQNPIIIRSQRKFLALMVLGGVISLLLPLMIVGELSTISCGLVPVMGSLGYLLLFGPLFLKSYRVSVIMNNRKMKQIRLTDAILVRRLAVLIVVNIGILVVMMSDDPPVPKTTKTLLTFDANTHSIPAIGCAVSEGSSYSTLLLFFLGCVTCYGAYISWTIRNTTADLSEAWYIFMSIYNGLVWSLLTLGIVMGVELTFAQQYTFLSLGIILTTTMTLSLILLPKFLNIKNKVTVSDLTNINSGASGMKTVAPTTSGGSAPIITGTVDSTGTSTVEIARLRKMIKDLGYNPETGQALQASG